MACLTRWMDWNLAGVFGSRSGLVSGILSSAHCSGFAVCGGAWVTSHALAAWYTCPVLIRSEEGRHELTAIIPVGLVAVHDVGKELYYSL
jgi:hypothetical protein